MAVEWGSLPSLLKYMSMSVDRASSSSGEIISMENPSLMILMASIKLGRLKSKRSTRVSLPLMLRSKRRCRRMRLMQWLSMGDEEGIDTVGERVTIGLPWAFAMMERWRNCCVGTEKGQRNDQSTTH